MKKLLFTTVSALILSAQAFAAPSSATQNSDMMGGLKPYISVKVGGSLVQTDKVRFPRSEEKTLNKDSNSKVFMVSPAIGIETPCETMRLEFEYTYRGKGDSKVFSDDTSDVYAYKVEPKTQSFMLNGYYTVPLEGAMKPYLGIGLGLTKAKVSTANSTNFTWSVGLGSTYDIVDGLSLDYGYRYVDMGKFNKRIRRVDGKFKTELSAHELYVGLRYAF